MAFVDGYDFPLAVFPRGFDPCAADEYDISFLACVRDDSRHAFAVRHARKVLLVSSRAAPRLDDVARQVHALVFLAWLPDDVAPCRDEAAPDILVIMPHVPPPRSADVPAHVFAHVSSLPSERQFSPGRVHDLLVG